MIQPLYAGVAAFVVFMMGVAAGWITKPQYKRDKRGRFSK